MKPWDKLSMKERAAYIKTAVNSGEYNRENIINFYNEFQERPSTNSVILSTEEAEANVKNFLAKEKYRSYNLKVKENPDRLDRLDKSVSGNIAKTLDPTGILSWNEAKNAYMHMGEVGTNAEDVLSMLGALPLIGKFKYLTKPAIMLQKGKDYQKAINAIKQANLLRRGVNYTRNAVQVGDSSVDLYNAETFDFGGFLSPQKLYK